MRKGEFIKKIFGGYEFEDAGRIYRLMENKDLFYWNEVGLQWVLLDEATKAGVLVDKICAVFERLEAA